MNEVLRAARGLGRGACPPPVSRTARNSSGRNYEALAARGLEPPLSRVRQPSACGSPGTSSATAAQDRRRSGISCAPSAAAHHSRFFFQVGGPRRRGARGIQGDICFFSFSHLAVGVAVGLSPSWCWPGNSSGGAPPKISVSRARPISVRRQLFETRRACRAVPGRHGPRRSATMRPWNTSIWSAPRASRRWPIYGCFKKSGAWRPDDRAWSARPDSCPPVLLWAGAWIRCGAKMSEDWKYFTERLRAIRSTPEFRHSKKAARHWSRIYSDCWATCGELAIGALGDFLDYPPKLYVPPQPQSFRSGSHCGLRGRAPSSKSRRLHAITMKDEGRELRVDSAFNWGRRASYPKARPSSR